MNSELQQLEILITNSLSTIGVLKSSINKKETEKKDLLKNLALGIIQTIDSFEDIEENIIERGLNKTEQVEMTMRRYSNIKRRLERLLVEYGITKVEFPDNRLIIGLCEVVDTVVDKTRNNEEIAAIVRNGYLRGKEIIRPAQIVVIKN